MLFFVPLSTGSIFSSAPCSTGGSTFVYLASSGDRCLSSAMKRSCRVVPN